MKYKLAEAFPPGEFLREELEERGWSQADFSVITGKDLRTINEVINGKRSITPETALVFGKALDTSPEVWLNLESHYRLWLAEAHSSETDEIPKRARLYTLPIRDMSRRGWINDEVSLPELERQLVDFFGPKCLEGILSNALALRKSGKKPVTSAQLAWLFRCKQLAEVLTVPAYSESKLRSTLGDLRAFLSSPEDAGQVASFLANSGVRYVVVEGLPGLKIDGVCFWLDRRSPAIAMSVRYDRIDNFWFVLRHEIEHVLRGDGKGMDITEVEPDSDLGGIASGSTSVAEWTADKAAADFCVPQDRLSDFIARVGPYYSRKQIEGFASLAQIHPGLVVGQLHNRRELPLKNLRKLLVGIREHVIRTAFTDGWGVFPQVHPKEG